METSGVAPSLLVLLPIILCTMAFFGLSLSLLRYMSWTGGWRELARAHQLDRRFEGHKWRFCSAVFREEVRYSRILPFGASREGLYVAVTGPFNYGHPPLLIPWSQVRKSLSHGARGRRAKLELGEKHPVEVSISLQLLDRIEQTTEREIADAA
jgi:hypothetical protein